MRIRKPSLNLNLDGLPRKRSRMGTIESTRSRRSTSAGGKKGKKGDNLPKISKRNKYIKNLLPMEGVLASGGSTKLMGLSVEEKRMFLLNSTAGAYN